MSMFAILPTARKPNGGYEPAKSDFAPFSPALPDPIVVADLHGEVLRANSAACQLLDRGDHELVGSNVFFLVPTALRHTAQRDVSELADGVTVETQWQAKDGRNIPVEIHSAGVLYAGQPALLLYVRDISQQKHAQQLLQQAYDEMEGRVEQRTAELKAANDELQESEQRFRRFVDHATDAFFLSTLDGQFLDVNRQACKSLGYARKRLMRLSVLEVDIDPGFKETFAQLQRGDLVTPTTIESVHRRKDGSTFSSRGQHQPLQVARATGSSPFSPVTSAIENRLRWSVWAWNGKCNMHRNSRGLGVLAGGIAHDFNNLLMAILGNAGLALEELSSLSPARGSIEEIEKAATRAAELAKQMLAYSGKGRFVVEPIDVCRLVEEMAHLLEVSISKKVVLKYDFADDLPTIDGDVTQIRQVVMNLITNASEAIGGKTGVIALSTGTMYCDRACLDEINDTVRAGLDRPLPEGAYVYFEVADTGCGMDAKTIEKIFDPFFTTKFTGRGLGMSAVLGIVRGHKGALMISSEVGRGTTFRVLFPVTERLRSGANTGPRKPSGRRRLARNWHRVVG